MLAITIDTFPWFHRFASTAGCDTALLSLQAAWGHTEGLPSDANINQYQYESPYHACAICRKSKCTTPCAPFPAVRVLSHAFSDKQSYHQGGVSCLTKMICFCRVVMEVIIVQHVACREEPPIRVGSKMCHNSLVWPAVMAMAMMFCANCDHERVGRSWKG